MLDSALSLVLKGYPVFPTWGLWKFSPDIELAKKMKEPCFRLISRWSKEATTDPVKIRLWFSGEYGKRLGCGIPSFGRIIVIDVDGDEGLRDWKKLQRELRFDPGPPAVKSPNGYHYYYLAPYDIANILNRARIEYRGRKLNIDIRTIGGYIVGPGSYGVNKKSGQIERYTEIRIPPISELPRLPEPLHRILPRKNPNFYFFDGEAGAVENAGFTFERSAYSPSPAKSAPTSASKSIQREEAVEPVFPDYELTDDEQECFPVALKDLERYANRIPDSRDGIEGDSKTFRVVQYALTHFPYLSDGGRVVLVRRWNDSLKWRWNDKALKHKIESALRYYDPSKARKNGYVK